MVNPFPNKLGFLHVCRTNLLKTLWEKEKLLVTNNFSFSNSVFYPFEELSAIFVKFEIVICKLLQFGRVLNLLSVNPFPNKPWFLRVCSTSLFENTVGKGQIARKEQFLLFPHCFLSVWRAFCYFQQI